MREPTEAADDAAKALGLDEARVERPAMSTNNRAERVMGRRGGGVPFDFPCEQGYRCPVCLVEDVGFEDEGLHWSEYNGFLWCDRCDRDWPSALCVPLCNRQGDEREWRHAIGPDAAVDVFLDTVEAAARNGPWVSRESVHDALYEAVSPWTEDDPQLNERFVFPGLAFGAVMGALTDAVMSLVTNQPVEAIPEGDTGA